MKFHCAVCGVVESAHQHDVSCKDTLEIISSSHVLSPKKEKFDRHKLPIRLCCAHFKIGHPDRLQTPFSYVIQGFLEDSFKRGSLRSCNEMEKRVADDPVGKDQDIRSHHVPKSHKSAKDSRSGEAMSRPSVNSLMHGKRKRSQRLSNSPYFTYKSKVLGHWGLNDGKYNFVSNSILTGDVNNAIDGIFINSIFYIKYTNIFI